MTKISSTKLIAASVFSLSLLFFSSNAFGQRLASKSSSTAYPNPTKDVIHIDTKFPLSELQGILVTNMNGKIVHGYTVEQGSNTLEVNLDKQPVGNYVVHLIYKEADERIQISKY